MLNIETVNKYPIAFKAPKNYNPPQTFNPNTGLPIGRDAYVSNESEEREKRKEKYMKYIAWAAVGAASIFGITKLVELPSRIERNKSLTKQAEEAAKQIADAMEKAGKDGSEHVDPLVQTTLNWQDYKGVHKVASLNSKTTSKSVREGLKGLNADTNTSETRGKWIGRKKGARFVYVFGHGGTGKSYMSEQYAQDRGAIFLSLKYPDFGSPYKDAASMKADYIMKEIEKTAQKYSKEGREVVVCVDEGETLLRKINDEAHGANEESKLRGAVLTGFDRIKKNCDNVTIFVTSNYHPESKYVDPIQLRRFARKIEVTLPDKEQSIELLKMYLKDTEALGKNFFESKETQEFAEKLVENGYSNGEISLIAEEAVTLFDNATKGVADSELSKHPFTVKYLEEAMKLKGTAASKTNDLMNVEKRITNEKQDPNNVIDVFRAALMSILRGNAA